MSEKKVYYGSTGVETTANQTVKIIAAVPISREVLIKNLLECIDEMKADFPNTVITDLQNIQGKSLLPGVVNNEPQDSLDSVKTFLKQYRGE